MPKRKKPKLPTKKKLSRIVACLFCGRQDSLEESLRDAAEDDPKWSVYADTVAQYRRFLRSMFTDNRELLVSQFDRGMRERAQTMTTDEVDAAILKGNL